MLLSSLDKAQTNNEHEAATLSEKTKFSSDNEPSLTLSEKLDYSTMLNNEPSSFESRMLINNMGKAQPINNEWKPLFLAHNKYISRRHKSFNQTKRAPKFKRLQKYKPTDSQDSSDTDEKLKIVSIPSPEPIENTPINVLKKMLTDDLSTPNNNKDAPYSFNNMKPYIFTLDKNNKK